MNKVHVFLKTPLCAGTLPGGQRMDRDILQLKGSVVETSLGGGWLSLEGIECTDLNGKPRTAPFSQLSLPMHKIDYMVPTGEEE